MAIQPLNGTKTHPLSAHAIEVLRLLAKDSIAAHRINPGVRNRLYREGLAETSTSVTPYSRQLRITDAGRARLAELDAQ